MIRKIDDPAYRRRLVQLAMSDSIGVSRTGDKIDFSNEIPKDKILGTVQITTGGWVFLPGKIADNMVRFICEMENILSEEDGSDIVQAIVHGAVQKVVAEFISIQLPNPLLGDPMDYEEAARRFLTEGE